MTESQVVNEWISQGETRGLLKQSQRDTLALLEGKFPGLVPEDVKRLIGQQDSLPIAHDWFRAAIAATSIEEFIAVLRC